MKQHAHPNAELTDTQLQHLADSLQKKRQELAEKLEALREQIVLKEDCSIADAAEAASLKEQRSSRQHRTTTQ